MSDVLHALETAGAILFGVIVLIAVITGVTVKRGESAILLLKGEGGLKGRMRDKVHH